MAGWLPDLFPRQFDLLRECRKRDGLRKYILINGARWSSKSFAAWNAIPDHAFNVENASVCILCKAVTSGSSSGHWNSIVEKVIPEWIAGGFGFDWAPMGTGRWKYEKATPRQDGTTKKLYCYVTNKFGGRSRIELNSLQDERDVEGFFKDRYFSMIYWPELSEYDEYKTFDTLKQALRRPGVSDEDHLLLADTNPSNKKHWAYKEWYELRSADPEDLTEAERPRQKHLRLLEFTLDDNLSLTEQRKKDILADFSYDPQVLARYGYGRWTDADTGGLFTGTFLPAIHVVGDEHDPDTEILVPQDGGYELLGGWDLGGTNSAFAVAEKMYPGDPSVPESSVFKFLDEAVLVGERLSIGDFTVDMALPVIDLWEAVIGKPVRWTHWSDRSAFDRWEPISKTYHHQEVYAASGGRIVLQSVHQGRESVAQRIRLWKKLLFQNRLLFSAARCPKLIEMNRNIRCGKFPYSVSANSEYKHIFDAASYIVIREAWNELEQLVSGIATADSSDARLISVRL